MARPAQPFYFGQPACFGWLHHADSKATDTADVADAADAAGPAARLPVVICGPVGAEDLSAHRLLLLAAEALAAQGQTCLRFDLPGQGDAAPLDPDADALPLWRAGVHAAIDALRAATGARRVALLGLRLGATLAALAAQERDDVAALAAWVPVISGRAMLREWRMLGAGGLPSLLHDDGVLESGGFRHAAATCAAIGSLSLVTPLVKPAPAMLVIDRADLPSAAPWCRALQAAGVSVDVEALPGYDGLLAVPHLARVPQQMLTRALAWLRDLRAGDVEEANAEPGLPSARWLIDGRAVLEQPVLLGGGSSAEPPLVAQRCETARLAPSDMALPRTAILMLNTGAERRIGPHGQFVALARHWAAAGALTLRLDLAGLGDSPARADAPQQQVYPPQAMDDLRRAVAYLRGQPGVRRVVALGLCSGAFHAFEALASGVAVDQAIAINPLLFFRPERLDFDAVPLQDHAVQQLSGEALKNLRDPARWRKLLRGQVNWRFITAMLQRRVALSGQRLLRAGLRTLGRPQADDLAAKLAQALHAPSVLPRLCFVFAEQDPGLALLRAGAGHRLGRWLRQDALRIVTVPGADHTFSRADARARLRDVLDELLGPLAPQEVASIAPALARDALPPVPQAVVV